MRTLGIVGAMIVIGLLVTRCTKELTALPPAEWIDLHSPVQGAVWVIDDTVSVTWTSRGISGQVKIELSRSGASWSTLATTSADDGSYKWIVRGPEAQGARIRVSHIDGSPSVTSGMLALREAFLDMVSILSDMFPMGSNSMWAYSDEQPVHEVTVSAFSIAKNEVTNEEMREAMQWAYDKGKVNATSWTVTNSEGDAQELLDLDDGDCEISYSGGTFTVNNGKEDHPCIEVTWYGGQAFCNYLSDMEGLERCIDFTDWSCDFEKGGYRLPTEGEWEYACRSGTTTDYYSGDETQSGCNYDPNLDAIGWYCYNASWTQQVGLRQASNWGLYDMSGNVWEWCNDWWGDYSDEAQTDPTGSPGGSNRVERGGSWYDDAPACRSTVRGGGSPGSSSPRIGFRPAR